MAEDWERLNDLKPGFEARPWYNHQGDSLHFVCCNEEYYRDRIDSVLTIYRSIHNEKAVGCQIKGIRKLVEEAGKIGIQIEVGGSQLMAVFLYALSHVPSTEPEVPDRLRAACGELMQRFGDQRFEVPPGLEQLAARQ